MTLFKVYVKENGKEKSMGRAAKWGGPTIGPDKGKNLCFRERVELEYCRQALEEEAIMVGGLAYFKLPWLRRFGS